MKITSCYKAKIRTNIPELEETIRIYRDVYSYLVFIIHKEWDDIKPIYSKSSQYGLMYVESLIHETKDNRKVKYRFDSKFPCFPSYFRRAAIAQALGAVSSWFSNHKNWEDSGKKTKEPKMTLDSKEI